MYRKTTLILLAMGCVTALPALAQRSLDIQGGFGLTGGLYANEFTLSVEGERETIKRDENVYGGTAGITAGLDGFYANTELELQQIDGSEGRKFKSTDFTLTLGKQFDNGWGPFVGFRHIRQGDGFYDSDIQRENGLFLGINYAGIPLGNKLIGSVGAAYVLSNIDAGGTKFDDADGVSLRASLAFAGTPHSISLRYRQFSGDVSDNFIIEPGEPPVRVNIALDESFLTLAYRYTLPITSFPMSSGF